MFLLVGSLGSATLLSRINFCAYNFFARNAVVQVAIHASVLYAGFASAISDPCLWHDIWHISSSLNTGNVVTFDTTDLSLPTDLVVLWSFRFSVTLDRLTIYPSAITTTQGLNHDRPVILSVFKVTRYCFMC
jgi:hypothetical protein